MIDKLIRKIDDLEKEITSMKLEPTVGMHLYHHNLKLVKELHNLRRELCAYRRSRFLRFVLKIYNFVYNHER